MKHIDLPLEKLKEEEIEWMPSWGADPHGRVFLRDGHKHRAIYPDASEFYERLFASGLIGDLVEKNLLPNTKPTQLRLDGYGLIIKQDIIPFVSYPFCWSPTMLKDAALAVLDLNIEAMEQGFATVDCHPFNVVFDGTNPKYVDIGSFVSTDRDAPWAPVFEFFEWYVHQLLLYRHKNYHRILRHLFTDSLHGIAANEYNAMSGRFLAFGRLNATVSLSGRDIDLSQGPWLIKRFLFSRGANSNNALIRNLFRNHGNLLPFADFGLRKDKLLPKLRKSLDRLDYAYPVTQWGAYYEEKAFDSNSAGRADPRVDKVYEIIKRTRPKTVLDVGANEGVFSILAAGLGARVVAVDYDAVAVDKLYKRIRKTDIGRLISPVVMNFIAPYKFGNAGLFSARPPKERFHSEMVMALGLTHHLALSQGIPFDYIIDALAEYVGRYLLVEFMPHGLGIERPLPDPLPAWYTLENFVKSLERHFSRVTSVESADKPSPRILLVCER